MIAYLEHFLEMEAVYPVVQDVKNAVALLLTVQYAIKINFCLKIVVLLNALPQL